MDLKPPTQQASPLRRWIRVHLLSPYLTAIPRNEKTLDLGCGWGFYFKINPDAYGIELDEPCVQYLKSQGYKVTRGSILDPLPFDDGSFDNCLTHDVLEHFDFQEVPTIFKNVHRVLKKGGLFINAVPNRRGYDLGLRENAGHKHFVTPEEIVSVARETGFVVESQRTSPIPAAMHSLFTHNKWVVHCRKP